MSNRTRLFLFKTLGMTLYALPLTVLAIIKREVFFAESEMKLTLYAYIAILLVVLSLKERTFTLAKKDPPLTMSLFLFVTSLIMQRFANELMYVGLCGITGSVLSAFISPVESVYYHLCYEDTVGGGRKRITSDEVPTKEAFRRAYL